MAKPKSISTKKFQRRDFMEQELAYSFRLGNDIVNDVKQVYLGMIKIMNTG